MKELYAELVKAAGIEAGRRTFLPLESRKASSCDNEEFQSARETLEYNLNFSFWSSRGSADPDEPEFLEFSLVDQGTALIQVIEIVPYCAHYQRKLPTYGSKAVRISVAMDEEFEQVVYRSQEMRCQCEDKFHTVRIDFQPMIIVGKFIRIEFLGKIQRQFEDNLFYISIGRIGVQGFLLSEIQSPLLHQVFGQGTMSVPRQKSHYVLELQEVSALVAAEKWDELIMRRKTMADVNVRTYLLNSLVKRKGETFTLEWLQLYADECHHDEDAIGFLYEETFARGKSPRNPFHLQFMY